MAIIYSGRYLLTEDFSIVEDGALLQEQGRIVALGSPRQLLQAYPGTHHVDFGEALLLPSFVNAHTHLELSLYPAWAQAASVAQTPCDFVEWILRLIQVKRSADPQTMTTAIQAGLELCQASGTAAIGDILSYYPGRSAYQQSPLLGTIFLESLGQDSLVVEQQFIRLKKVLKEQDSGHFSYGISPHSPYTIRPGYMAELYAYCQAQDYACSTHIAESQAEVELLAEAEGALVERLYPQVNWHQHIPEACHQTPIEFLADRGGLFQQHLLVHGVQLSAAEITLIAEAQASLVLCPRSNAFLQVGTAPVAQLKAAGVRLALGTDSLASNQSLSMWDELAAAVQQYGETFNLTELFNIATQGGADALGLGQQFGSLSVGKRCSFQVLDPATGVQRQNLLDASIRQGDNRQISAIVLDGAVVKS